MANKAQYNCKFGPDVDGQYIEENVLSNVALNCGSFCECVGFTNNTCLFGPDSKGHFFTDDAVPSEQVDDCGEFCICDKHIDVLD